MFTVTPVQDVLAEDEVLVASNVITAALTGGHPLSVSRDADMPLRGDGIKLTIIDDDSGGPAVRLSNCVSPTNTQIEFIAPENLEDRIARPVTGFVVEDLVLVNVGSPMLAIESGFEYRLSYEWLPDFEGEVTVTVPAGVALDSEARPNSAASCSTYVDARKPRVEIRGPASDVPVGAPFPVRVVFDEPVLGFALDDLVVGNGTVTALEALESSRSEVGSRYREYAATVTPSGAGAVTVDLRANRVRDGFRNGNLAADRFSVVAVAPQVHLTLSHETLAEGSGPVAVAVTATLAGDVRGVATEVAVTVSGSGLSGRVGFAPVEPFTLTIPAQHGSATAQISLTPRADDTATADETVTVAGAAPGVTVYGATLTLADDDKPSTGLELRLSRQTVSEGAGSTTVGVSVGGNHAAFPATTTVTLTVTGSGAAGEVAYAPVQPWTADIVASSPRLETSFILTPTDDAVDTADTTLTVTATAAGLEPAQAALRIVDDDEGPSRVVLSVSEEEVGEGGGPTTVTLTARHDGAAGIAPLPVAVSVAGVGADAGDFAQIDDFTLEIPAGATSAERQLVLHPVADALDEPDETIAVRGTAQGLTVVPATITIVDDDEPPNLSIAGATGSEGAGALAFAVALDAPSGREVRVAYASADGTALAGTDYLAVADTVTFAPGEIRRTVTVDLVDDDLYEMAEAFTVTLAGAVNATLNPDRAVAGGRILNDDPMPRIRLAVASPSPAVVSEDGGAVPITVIGRLEGATRSVDTTLALSVTGGTAVTGDFAPIAASLTIPAGEAAGVAVFELTPVADTDVEGDETVELGSTTPGVQVIPATIVIEDDDDVTPPALSGATVEGRELTLVYGETLDEDSVPAPSVWTVVVDSAERAVTAVAVRGARVTLTLASAVESGQTVTVSYDKPAAGPVRDEAGNPAASLTGVVVDSGTPPVVTGVRIVSRSLGGVPYGAGDTIRVRVRFSEAVTITGVPLLYLTVGDKRRPARYDADADASKGRTAEFAYRVVSGDFDDDGIGIGPDSLDAPGAVTITDTGGNPADLSHPALVAGAAHQVDGVAPALRSAAVDGTSLVLTYDEALDESSRPAPSTYRVRVQDGGAGAAPSAVAVNGTTVTLTLAAATAVVYGQAVTVSYDKPVTGPVRDAAGNAAAPLTEHPVTVTSEPAGTLELTLDAIAGDGVVNIAEKAQGFAITGDVGTESGVSVTVTVGTETLSATSETDGSWSVTVEAAASYLTGSSVAVTVAASKTGYTAAAAVTRTLMLDLVAPSSRTYTVPGSLQVGVPVTAMTPSTTGDTDIASWSAMGLPAGLDIASGTGVIGGTPTTANAGTAAVTVTITDDAGNETTVSLTLPAVSKGVQDLSGFGYAPPTVTFGDAAPSLTVPADPKGAVTYSATPSSVCTVNAGTGVLVIVGAGTCVVTATAAATADYEAASEAFTVTVEAAGTLELTLDAIAGDGVVNIAEKAQGFAIRGRTGTESGVSVTVEVGTETLSATTETDGTWSATVPADADYLTGTDVSVTVEASKTGYTAATPVTRTLTLDLVAPSSRTYTVPGSLQVGVPVTGVTPSTTTDTDVASYRAAGLPAGLAIDTGTGLISGTPTTANAGTAAVTVTVTDTAGNETTVSLTFPAVSKGEQDLSGFGYAPPRLTFGDSAPSLTAPADPKGAVTYATTSTGVCSVNAGTGALVIVGAGTCVVTVAAAGDADYEAASEAFTVTVAAAGTLTLSLDAIAGDDVVNIAEKASGFAIRGRTGTESGVSVTVEVGTETLSATTETDGTWSATVPADADYLTGTDVSVTVEASKTGYTAATPVTRTLTLDLVAPSSRTYTVPGSLQVGVPVTGVTPSTTTDTDVASYRAAGLPAGLAIDTGTGLISGTPTTANAGTAAVTVTVTDTAGNETTVSLTFPAVSKGEQDLSGFGYAPPRLTFGDSAPSLTRAVRPEGRGDLLGHAVDRACAP